MEKIITIYKTYNRSITIGALGILALSIPIIISQVLQPQDIRQRAAESTIVLSLSPSSGGQPINTIFDVSLVLNPGGKDISAIDSKLKYDSGKLELLPAITVGAPYNLLESQSATVTASQTTTKRIVMINQTATTTTNIANIAVAVFKFKTLTSGTANISFGNTGDFGTTIDISASGIGGNILLSTTSQLTGSYTINSTNPTPTPTIASTPTPTPTLMPNETRMTLSHSVPGIAPSSPRILVNNNPNTKTRLINARIFDANELEVDLNGEISEKLTTGSAIFSQSNHKFISTISLGTTGITTGTNPYTVYVKLSNSLWRKLPGIKNITKNSDNDFNATNIKLVTGDIDGDKKLTVADYTLMTGCVLQPPNNTPKDASCNETRKNLADITDDGKVDEKDIAILLAGFSERNGDL